MLKSSNSTLRAGVSDEDANVTLDCSNVNLLFAVVVVEILCELVDMVIVTVASTTPVAGDSILLEPTKFC